MSSGDRTADDSAAVAAGSGGPVQPIEIMASKGKYLGMALPCLLISLAALDALRRGVSIAEDNGMGVDIGVFLVGLVTAATLIYLGFDRKPVLTIGEDGIRCRRPAIGLIPWDRVMGMGFARPTAFRKQLLVAVDTDNDIELQQRLKRFTAGGFNRGAAHFRGQMQGLPTVQIPISMLAIKQAELQQLIEERISYSGN